MPRERHIQYEFFEPTSPLSSFVKYFWHLKNTGPHKKAVTVLPDGYFDLLIFSENGAPVHYLLLGLATKPIEYIIPARSITFAVSFKLPAAEYFLNESMTPLLNKDKTITDETWRFDPAAFLSLADFSACVTGILLKKLPEAPDKKKMRLFDFQYGSNGGATVAKAAETSGWSQRQINRYFTAWFGLSLKAYCSILRYRASFGQLKAGQLFPQQNYSDQAHFIKEVKKYSGAIPGKLAKNKNDRFIQLATLGRQ